MIDHFSFVATIYDRIIGAPNVARMERLFGLPDGGWLLDAGGGTGRVSSRLRHLAGNIVVGDLSLAMLRQSKIKGGLNPVRIYTECLPFYDEAFTKILVVDALHHHLNQQQALSELLRVLKPGGRLVIEEPDINLMPVKLISLVEKVFMMQSHFQTSAEIIDMIRSGGASAAIMERGHFRVWISAVKNM